MQCLLVVHNLDFGRATQWSVALFSHAGVVSVECCNHLTDVQFPSDSRCSLRQSADIESKDLWLTLKREEETHCRYSNRCTLGKAPSFRFSNPGSSSHSNTHPDHLLVVILLLALMHAAPLPYPQNCCALAGVTHKNPEHNKADAKSSMQECCSLHAYAKIFCYVFAYWLVKRQQAQQVMKLGLS